MGERRGVYRVLAGKTEGKDCLEDPGVDGSVILIWIFGTWNGGRELWTALIELGVGTGGELL